MFLLVPKNQQTKYQISLFWFLLLTQFKNKEEIAWPLLFLNWDNLQWQRSKQNKIICYLVFSHRLLQWKKQYVPTRSIRL